MNETMNHMKQQNYNELVRQIINSPDYGNATCFDIIDPLKVEILIHDMINMGYNIQISKYKEGLLTVLCLSYEYKEPATFDPQSDVYN